MFGAPLTPATAAFAGSAAVLDAATLLPGKGVVLANGGAAAIPIAEPKLGAMLPPGIAGLLGTVPAP